VVMPRRPIRTSMFTTWRGEARGRLDHASYAPSARPRPPRAATSPLGDCQCGIARTKDSRPGTAADRKPARRNSASRSAPRVCERKVAFYTAADCFIETAPAGASAGPGPTASRMR
jgi:hypothetical protein